MSTRCQVIVKDEYSEVWLYRHSDGYPEVTKPSLEKFLSWVKDGKIRADAMQSAGWLVILGHQEYAEYRKATADGSPGDWKVGAYEPCEPKEHGDIEYLYTVDLIKRTVKYKKV